MSSPAHGRVFAFGEFRLDVAERSLIGPDGVPVQLTRKVFDALVFMVERPGRLLYKQALMDAIWRDVLVEENSLNQLVSTLRRLLGERPGERRYIATIPGVGYRFVPPVAVTAMPSFESAAQRSTSIAVLPFEDLSQERDQGYFAGGIAEEILNRLARIEGLRVIGRTSSFHFRGRNKDTEIVAGKLGVEHLLVGAVRKDGRRLRITAQLVDAAGVQQWSERFDRELRDVFTIQEDIAGAVAAALQLKLGVGETPAAPGGTSHLDAYDAYLRAKAVAHQSGAQAMIRSAELYREALSLDSKFALAWVGLAEACRGLLIFAPERAGQARRDLDVAAARALEQAPDLWASHIAQTWRQGLDRDWRAGERSLARARELMPGSAGAYHFDTAVFLEGIGQADLAVEHFQTASRDDPLSLLTSSLLQKAFHIAGRHDAAEAEYRRSLDLPGSRDIAEHMALQRAWIRGAEEEIRAKFRRYLEHQTVPMPVLHEVFGVFDSSRSALELLHKASDDPMYQSAIRQTVLAWWMAHYGDAEAALAASYRAQIDLDGAHVGWLWLPVLHEMRRKPGFKQLVGRLGLVDYWRATGKWGTFARPIGHGDFECF